MVAVMGKSGPPCTICQSPHRHAIDLGLVAGVGRRVLAQRYQLGADAIWRHGRSHLTKPMRAALLAARKPSDIDLDALRESEQAGLLASLVHQRARLQTHVELAAAQGDPKAAIAGEGAITSNLTLVAKLLGQLVQVHDVRHTSILISSDYLVLRQAIVTALKPFPAAASAVGAALAHLEQAAATEITDAAAKRQRAPAGLIEHDASERPRKAPRKAAAPAPEPLPPLPLIGPPR